MRENYRLKQFRFSEVIKTVIGRALRVFPQGKEKAVRGINNVTPKRESGASEMENKRW